MPKHGKKYLEAKKLVEPGRAYSPEEAIDLAKKTSFARFDATIEAHMHLGVDARRADEQVRGVVLLPHGTGKQVRILVFAEGESESIAREAGADYVGGDELIEKIRGGWVDFDVAMAIPRMMGKVSRLGRILGPRGLMPNPKAGTVVASEDIPRLMEELRRGRVEFRNDSTANLHVPIGKASFSDEELLENLVVLMGAVLRARPSGARGQYIRSLAIASTMGPGIKVGVSEAMQLRST